MKNYEALGVVEAQYFTVAMELLDQMCKSSNVEFLTSEKYLGGRLVTQIVGGSIQDVTSAIELVKEICASKPKNPLKMALVITNPHSEILKFIVEKQAKPISQEKKKQTSYPIVENLTEESKADEVITKNQTEVKELQKSTPAQTKRTQRRTNKTTNKEASS